jgi:hypothetical protein
MLMCERRTTGSARETNAPDIRAQLSHSQVIGPASKETVTVDDNVSGMKIDPSV